MVNNKKIILGNIDENWFNSSSFQKRDRVYLLFKRIMDIVLGFVGFIIFISSFPFIAIAIKLDSEGKILYIQERVGKNGTSFKLYKFRTMYEVGKKNSVTWRERDKIVLQRLVNF